MRRQVRHSGLVKPPVERLTWNPRWPAPLESAWSVVSKICRLNHLTFHEFVRLVALPDETITITSRLFLDSEWVDFERLSRLLDVDEDRIRECFLDQLFMWQDDSHEPYQPRQCLQCSADGYHCVLFDLAIMEECPWHRQRLTGPCAACGASHVIGGYLNARKLHLGRCIHCRAPYFSVEDLLALSAMPAKQARAIRRDADGFINWWVAAFVQSGANGLLSELVTVNPDFHWRENTRLQLGLAVALAEPNAKWGLAVEPVCAHRVSWRRNAPAKPSEDLLREFNAELYRSYRAVRRHIWKNYLKGHEHCVQCLTRLNRDEAFCLNGSQVCIVALSFLVWRMSIESVADIQELNKQRTPRFFLRLHGSDRAVDIGEQPYWFYYKFFLIWEMLNYHLRYRKLKLRFDGPFYTMANESSWIEDETANKDRQKVFLIVPDTEKLKAGLPVHRRQSRYNVVDQNSLANRLQWSEYRLEVGTERVMFASRPEALIRKLDQFYWKDF